MSRPSAYKGNDPYIFVSYCHKDDARVWAMIEGLQKRGMRVWYDEGIEWGSHWDQVIFEHLSGCAYVVAFVTKDFLRSENCMDEISYAKEEQKGPFIVFLDNLELTGMMKYRYGRLQALNLSQFDKVDTLLDKLSQNQALSACTDCAAAVRSSAEEWYEKGGWCYIEGKYADAVKCYLKAAECGHADAQFNLGVCYQSGTGVEKNMAEAAKWFSKAAEQGHSSAQDSLGICYYSGTGVEKNVTEAAKWFRNAAEQGEVRSQYILGCCYAAGVGVSKNITEAVKWLRNAARQENADAQELLTKNGLTW